MNDDLAPPSKLPPAATPPYPAHPAPHAREAVDAPSKAGKSQQDREEKGSRPLSIIAIGGIVAAALAAGALWKASTSKAKPKKHGGPVPGKKKGGKA